LGLVRSGRNAARAALGFGGSSTGFPVGLSPTPLAHVSASPLCDPGRWDFPSPVLTLACSSVAFPSRVKLKR
jgi:hypothetical protein